MIFYLAQDFTNTDKNVSLYQANLNILFLHWVFHHVPRWKIGIPRAFNIFQVYQYFTIYRQYFLLKFYEYLIQHSLISGGTKHHFRQVKIPGTAPYWKVWCPQVEIEIPSLYKLLSYRKERIKVIYHQLQNFILLSFPFIVQWKPKIWINFCQHQKYFKVVNFHR